MARCGDRGYGPLNDSVVAVSQLLRERLEVIEGDITRVEVDSIVNAANESLLGGGGVDGAIHRAAGPQLLEACRLFGGCPVGQARITPGYDLPARFVIHAVGPIWRGGEHREGELLASAYRNSLELAAKNDIASIAFPAISCGAYGYPIEAACRVALQTIGAHIRENPLPEHVLLVCFDRTVAESYRSLL
jgi:O-acetyl-ADP-ribose deacetylase